MTFTWIGDLSTDLDKVRANLGDTDSTDQLLQDEQINGVLAVITDINMASAALADQIAATYARKVDVGHLSARKSASQLFRHYGELANRLRALGPGDVVGGSSSRAGGIRITGTKESDFTSTDSSTYTKGPFQVGRDNHPGGYSPNRDGNTYEDEC